MPELTEEELDSVYGAGASEYGFANPPVSFPPIDASQAQVAAPVVAPPQIVPPPQTAGFIYGSSRYENEPPVPRPTDAQLNALPFDTLSQLPSGGWGVRESVEHRQRLQEFERQAQQARQAAESAARDAQMLDQMSRAAHSMKDIENARHQIDVMSLQRELSSLGPAATPAQYAATMMRHPLAAGSAGLAAALHYGAPIAAPTFGKTPGGAEYSLYGNGIHFTPQPSVSSMAPQEVEALPRKDKNGRIIAWDAGGGHIFKEEAQGKVPIDIAEEVKWHNADIKAAATRKADLLKQGYKEDAADVKKLDELIESHKTAVRDLNKSVSGTPAPVSSGKRVAVIGPGGRRGTMPKGSKLPEGWKLAP